MIEVNSFDRLARPVDEAYVSDLRLEGRSVYALAVVGEVDNPGSILVYDEKYTRSHISPHKNLIPDAICNYPHSPFDSFLSERLENRHGLLVDPSSVKTYPLVDLVRSEKPSEIKRQRYLKAYFPVTALFNALDMQQRAGLTPRIKPFDQVMTELKAENKNRENVRRIQNALDALRLYAAEHLSF